MVVGLKTRVALRPLGNRSAAVASGAQSTEANRESASTATAPGFTAAATLRAASETRVSSQELCRVIACAPLYLHRGGNRAAAAHLFAHYCGSGTGFIL